MDEYTTATELNHLAGAGAAAWIALVAGGFSATSQNRSSKYSITPGKSEWVYRSPANIETPARDDIEQCSTPSAQESQKRLNLVEGSSRQNIIEGHATKNVIR
jgi:hypothetical protein